MTEPLTLGIETATNLVGVAVGEAGAPIAAVEIDRGRRHGELLAPAIQTILRLANVHIRDIERVAVDNGPGLFTGLRVGIATAKALASALDVPAVPCSSLDLLAHPHRAAGAAVVAVVDARRGEVFWAEYVAGGDGMVATTEPRVNSPEQLFDALRHQIESSGPMIATGDGARRYAELLGSVDGLRLTGPEHDHPSPKVLVELAATRAALCPDKITAEYLRGPDVRIGWEQRDEPD
ncbi:MAG TPA: tRNA (adenosine(37)-N6)-threonylcarbamoyltransferase complex dimerization subunit type 1 TsaB [Acidimicrobiales bacterium]